MIELSKETLARIEAPKQNPADHVDEADAILKEYCEPNSDIDMGNLFFATHAYKELAEKYRRALEFYAEGKHIPSEWSNGKGDVGTSGGEDGRLAREALGLSGEEKR